MKVITAGERSTQSTTTTKLTIKTTTTTTIARRCCSYSVLSILIDAAFVFVFFACCVFSAATSTTTTNITNFSSTSFHDNSSSSSSSSGSSLRNHLLRGGGVFGEEKRGAAVQVVAAGSEVAHSPNDDDNDDDNKGRRKTLKRNSSHGHHEKRGTTKQTKKGRRRRRRKPAAAAIQNETECLLFVDDTQHLSPEEDHWGAYEEDPPETWYCQLEKEFAKKELDLDDPLLELTGLIVTDEQQLVLNDDDNTNNNQTKVVAIESGKSILRFRGGVIDRVDNVLYVDASDVSGIVTKESRSGTRKKRTVGVRKTLVVRLSTSNGIEPDVSTDEIRRYVYENEFSLKKQYEKCSYGGFILEPYRGAFPRKATTKTKEIVIENGIFDVRLSEEESLDVCGGLGEAVSIFAIAKTARSATSKALGIDDVNGIEDVLDHVLFVFPSCVGGFSGMALINRYDSYYTRHWITKPSITIHEIGHNLGLRHSGDEYDSYNDEIGYMGYGDNDRFGPSKCFVPPNSYYLGWYPRQTETYDPTAMQQQNLEEKESSRATTTEGYYSVNTLRLFTLNGVDDYNDEIDDDGRRIVVRLLQKNKKEDYYLGYNRQKGINYETVQNPNEVTVHEKLDQPDVSKETKKRASLKNVGDQYEIVDYNDEKGLIVVVTLESISNDLRDAVVSVRTERMFVIFDHHPDQHHPPPNNDFTYHPRPTKPPAPTDPPSANRSDFAYRNDPNKDCNWIKNLKRKRKRLCGEKKKWNKRSIQKYWCPETCK